MSRPKEKNNRVHPVLIFRIKKFCFGNLQGFYDTYLHGHVAFDIGRFKSMMREEFCHEKEESALYLRLAAVERQVREDYAKWDLIDEGQVQWAVERAQEAKV